MLNNLIKILIIIILSFIALFLLLTFIGIIVLA